MKKKAFVVLALAVALAAAVGFVVLRRGAQTYTYVLPADLKAVAAVDVADWVRQADLPDGRLQELVLGDADAGTAGLDFSKKMYIFVAADDYVGVALAVEDADRLQGVLAAQQKAGKCEPVREQRGFRWTTVDGQWLVAFDDDRLLAMGPAMGAQLDGLRNRMAAYLRQKREESGVVTPLFTELSEQEGALSLVARLDALPASGKEWLRMGLPEEVPPQDVRLAASLHADGNRLALRVALRSDNPALKKQMEAVSNLLRPLRGDLAACGPQRPLVWAGFNANGEKLLEELRTNPQIRTALIMLNFGVDVDMMLKSIDGDVSVAVEGLGSNFSIPTLLTAQLARTDFLSKADYWERSLAPRSDVRFKRRGTDRFNLLMGAYSVFFGVKDKCLYVANDERLEAAAVVEQPGAGVADYRREMKGCLWYVTVDLAQLWQQLGAALPVADGAIDAGFRQRIQASLVRLVVKSDTPLQVDVELYAPAGTNLLKEWLNHEHN